MSDEQLWRMSDASGGKPYAPRSTSITVDDRAAGKAPTYASRSRRLRLSQAISLRGRAQGKSQHSRLDPHDQEGRSSTHTRTNAAHAVNHAPNQPPPPPPLKEQVRHPQAPLPETTRITARHILFSSGPLSNKHHGVPFPGGRALDFLFLRIELAEIPHPSGTALSSRLLDRHMFTSTEQFIMACKAWFFEREPILEGIEFETLGMRLSEVEELCATLVPGPSFFSTLPPEGLIYRPPSSSSAPSGPRTRPRPNPPGRKKPGSFGLDLNTLRAGTLATVLRSSNPRDQQDVGHQRSRGFDDGGKEAIWKRVSHHVAVAACVTRAEYDPDLRRLYFLAANGGADDNTPSFCATRRLGYHSQPKPSMLTFVQCKDSLDNDDDDNDDENGVWGVGLTWDDPRAEDKKSWMGENRLGKCHDVACQEFIASYSG